MSVRRALPFLICAAVLGVPSAAHAATYTVNTTDDVAGSCPTTCSLRAAVTAATASTGVDDTIVLDAKTYTLTAGALTINPVAADTLTIAGAGARSTTISGNNASRVFEIGTSGVSPTVTISGVRLTGGLGPTMGTGAGDGGAIFAGDGNITIDRSAITGNTAPLSGGGIATDHFGTPVVAVTSSTIANNTAGGPAATANAIGGGIFNGGGAMTITNSTVAANTAQTTLLAQGGGLGATTPGTYTLVNSTIAGNTAQGATATGGGVTLASAGSATNTIVAGNKAVAGGTSSAGDCTSAFNGTIANDLSSDASCGFTTANGGKPNTEPQLSALGDHGGPTDTLSIPDTSPAADAGTSAGCPATDQRGVIRPVGPACDMGAVENAKPVVGTAPPLNIGTNDASLRATVRNPLVSAALVTFQYGRTTGYGSTVAAAPVTAGISTPVSAQVSKLTSGTSYQYRAVVFNADGLTVGPNQGFNTLAAGKKPFLKVTGTPRSCRKTTFELRIRTRVSGQGVTFNGARVLRDGKSAKLNKTVGRFRVKINPAKLKAGRHTLLVRARDSKNRLTVFRKSFSRCKATPAKRKKKG